MATVLLCSEDDALSKLIHVNLERRGFQTHHTVWDTCLAEPAAQPRADVVLADLVAPEPDCWNDAGRMRQAFPGVPLILFAHAWPDHTRLQPLHPCHCLRKPFAVESLLGLLADVTHMTR